LIGLEADGGIDGFAEDGFGMLLGNFFDFHSAGGAGHEDGPGGFAVDDQAEIEFALDVQTFFDEQTFYDAADGSGLNSDEIHAQHVAGDFGGFFW